MEAHHLTAIDMLARGLPTEHIAKKLNVSDRTVRRWKLIPEFAEELRLTVETYRLTLEVRYDRIVGKCQLLTDEALEKVAQVMRSALDARICLGAANTLLNHCTRMSRRQIALANMANLEKADKTGPASATVPLETPPQKRTSPATAAQQPEAAKPVTTVQPMSATGHAARPGATDALTAVPSVHPCPANLPTQKADIIGHRPETPSTSTAYANRTGTDESGIRHPDASVAPHLTPKADVNGDAVAADDPELQALKVHRAYRERIAASKAPQIADKNGHASPLLIG